VFRWISPVDSWCSCKWRLIKLLSCSFYRFVILRALLNKIIIDKNVGDVELIPELIEYALQHREEILENAQSLRVNKKDAIERWIKYNPSSFEREFRVSATDGSLNFMEFRGFMLYAINAVSILYSRNGFEKEVKTGKVGLLPPSENVLERVRAQMGILEAKTTLNLIEEGELDLSLIDGSFISFLVKLRGIENDIKMFINLDPDFMEKYINAINEPKLDILAEEKATDIIGRDLDTDVLLNSMLTLEKVELLNVLIKLFRRYGGKLVAISKTSTSRRYFRYSLKPDLVIFDKLTQNTGFSKPNVVKLSLPKALKNYLDFSEDLMFTVFYARLEPREQVFRIEVFGERSMEDIKKLLDDLSVFTVRGYPYPLRRAHQEVEIRGEDMLRIYRILSLYHEERGREVLL